jgi:hypothetical protein
MPNRRFLWGMSSIEVFLRMVLAPTAACAILAFEERLPAIHHTQPQFEDTVKMAWRLTAL